jgi:addiction module RelE/StbE family toxin
MDVSFSTSFKKALEKRAKSTEMKAEFWIRVELFIKDPFDPKLRTHKLSGKLRNLWSFTIENDVRVVFFFTDDKPKKAVFVDLGSHNEVY